MTGFVTGRGAMRAAMLASLAALAACTTSAPETRVTRFHLGQPIAPGDVAIEPLNPAAAGSLELETYSGAVARELTRLGFRPINGVSKSEIVAVVGLNRGFRENVANGGGSGVSVGLGGGGFSGGRRGGGVGLGGGISFPIGGRGRGREIAATELSVQLKRRSDNSVIWEGRAQNEVRSNSPSASPAASADTLARALFEGFPGESGRTITVK